VRQVPGEIIGRELIGWVEAFVAQMAAKSASAVSLAKNLLYHMDNMSFEAAIEAGVQTNAIARSTEDCKRGIERFLKKKT